MKKIVSTIVVLTLFLSLPVYAAETETASSVVDEQISTYSTTLLNYAGNFYFSYSTTITVPYNANVTLIYGANIVSGSSRNMEIKIAKEGSEFLSYFKEYSAGSGAKLEHLNLSAGTYNVQFWGDSGTEYRGAINMYIP
ncbi:MAG: hypothetical protein ACLU84_06375 [Clostridia bacterium]